MASDYGIKKILTELTEAVVKEVLSYIYKFGVKKEADLKELEESDLVNNTPLTQIEARKLLKKWNPDGKLPVAPSNNIGHGIGAGSYTNSNVGNQNQNISS